MISYVNIVYLLWIVVFLANMHIRQYIQNNGSGKVATRCLLQLVWQSNKYPLHNVHQISLASVGFHLEIHCYSVTMTIYIIVLYI